MECNIFVLRQIARGFKTVIHKEISLKEEEEGREGGEEGDRGGSGGGE